MTGMPVMWVQMKKNLYELIPYSDFGDELHHQLVVSGIRPLDVNEDDFPRIVKRVGESISQYDH
jgi:hypothetical protein